MAANKSNIWRISNILLCNIFLNSCGTNIDVKDGIPQEKAEEFLHKYSVEFQQGVKRATIRKCDFTYSEMCTNDEYYAKLFGEFCECDYVLTTTDGMGCFRSIRVLETCGSESCVFKFHTGGVGTCE